MRVPLPPRRPRAPARGLAFLALGALLSTFLLFLSNPARAEAPNTRALPVHVISIDSDDAEDQADALTQALRSRIRLAPGWSLQETQHTLSVLTAALRCPTHPDAACLGRIGDQLHIDRFVWGVASKAPGNQITAEVHLWTRGKPDASTKETYSDNLKDGNDETLRKLAARIFDRLAGTSSNGTLTVHAGDVEGRVWVNGQDRAPLDRGAATVDLPAGTYSVEVHASGFQTGVQTATVTGGQETPVVMKLAPIAPVESAPQGSSKPTDARRIVAWSLMGLGAVGLAVGAFEGVEFLSIKSDLDDDRNKIDKSITDVCTVNPATNPTAGDACTKLNDAKTTRTVGVLSASAGAVALVAGLVLLVTDQPKETGGEVTISSVRVTPFASPKGEAGVSVGLTF